MLREYVKYNLNLMTKQKTFRFAFAMMMLISIIVPVYNVIRFWGAYTYALPSADTLYIGNGSSELWGYFALIFPFFIVLPYGLSFLNESKTGVILYVQTRGNRKNYYYGQLITCFIGIMIVFLITLLFNILLNTLLFPINGNDYVSTYNYYDMNWANAIMGQGFYREVLFEGVLFKKLAISHPQLYNILYAFWFSFAAGIMGMFTYAVSIVLKKKSVYLMIANYLFFTIFSIIDRISEDGGFGVYINTNLTDYFSNGLFNSGLVYPLFFGLLVCELIVSVCIIRHRLQEDEV